MSTDPLAEPARHEVLTAWGAQRYPLVLAHNMQQGKFWLTQNDDYLSKQQGSYANMVITPYSVNRIRGWRGTLVIIRAARQDPPPHWAEALEMVSHAHGISIWTETLP